MAKLYQTLAEGQWKTVTRKGYRLGCCDCGLVHDFEFRIKGRRIQYRVWRNERASGQVRRWMKDKLRLLVRFYDAQH